MSASDCPRFSFAVASVAGLAGSVEPKASGLVGSSSAAAAPFFLAFFFSFRAFLSASRF
jgi:hypothetical protein